MRKRGVKSPDRADSSSMAYAAPEGMEFVDVPDEVTPAAGADLDHLLGAPPRITAGAPVETRELDRLLGDRR
jgi:hypothetical protein